MTNHVRIEIDGNLEIEADVESVTLQRNYTTGAFTLQGGAPSQGRGNGGGLSGVIGAGLPALAEKLKQQSKDASAKATVAAQAAEAAKAANPDA